MCRDGAGGVVNGCRSRAVGWGRSDFCCVSHRRDRGAAQWRQETKNGKRWGRSSGSEPEPCPLNFPLMVLPWSTDESLLPLPLTKPTYEKLPLSVTQANPALAPFLLAEGLSSMETLLTNIQVMIKTNRKWLYLWLLEVWSWISGLCGGGLSGAAKGGGAERPMSRQTKPDGEERVKSGAGQRERCQTDSPETAELWAADQRWARV